MSAANCPTSCLSALLATTCVLSGHSHDHACRDRHLDRVRVADLQIQGLSRDGGRVTDALNLQALFEIGLHALSPCC